MKYFALVLFVVLCLACGGIHGRNNKTEKPITIVGTWEIEGNPAIWQRFNEDGTYESYLGIGGKWKLEGDKLEYADDVKMTVRIEGDKLTTIPEKDFPTPIGHWKRKK